MTRISALLTAAGIAAAAAGISSAPAFAEARNIVLVHGAPVDGSGWQPV